MTEISRVSSEITAAPGPEALPESTWNWAGVTADRPTASRYWLYAVNSSPWSEILVSTTAIGSVGTPGGRGKA